MLLLLMLLLRPMVFLLGLVMVGTMLVLLVLKPRPLLEASPQRRRRRSDGGSASKPSTKDNKLCDEMHGGGVLRTCRWALLVAGSSSLLISVGLAAVAAHAWRLLVVSYALAAVAR